MKEPPSDLAQVFGALGPKGKAYVLARAAHWMTIVTRAEAYVVGEAGGDGTILRGINERVHRLCGYMIEVLADDATPEQDASFADMLVVTCNSERLRKWIGEAGHLGE